MCRQKGKNVLYISFFEENLPTKVALIVLYRENLDCFSNGVELIKIDYNSPFPLTQSRVIIDLIQDVRL